MNRFDEIKNFIKRVESEFSDQIEKGYQEKYKKRLASITRWNNENREKLQKCMRNYSKTKKGQIASIRRNCTRHERYRDACKDLSHEELEEIKQFYVNCPSGHEVDHIIPISRGGQHNISNLQYLPIEINRMKRNKLPEEISDKEWYKPYV